MTKKITWIFVLMFGISSAFVSCKKKGCTDSSAKNYCDKCKKDDGSCQYTTAQDYVGTWSVGGSCSSTYSMNITASGATLTFSRLQNCFTITASVSDKNLFTIPTQTVTPFTSPPTSVCGGPYIISGSGSIGGTNYNTLQCTYTVKDFSNNTTSCSATATK